MHSRQNILFLTHRVPFPSNKGDKIRTFHQMEYLAARHNVYCACFVDRPADRVHAIALRQWCKGVIAIPWDRRTAIRRAVKGFWKGRSLTCAAYDDPTMWHHLREWARAIQFDAVTAFSGCMAPYAWAFPAGRRILDLCDIDSRKWHDYAGDSLFPLSTAYRAEGRRLAAFERRCADHFDSTIVATPRERELIDPEQRQRTLYIVPNGVDLPALPPEPPSANPPIVTFVGAMNYRPNVDGVLWFVRRVWPRIVQATPDARFVMVGADPALLVRRLSRFKNIVVTGEVPGVQPYLRASRVVIAPMPIVRGIPNKVLEAMAMARPVVGTPGVAAALGAQSGRHLMTGESPEAFADHVIALLTDSKQCDRIAAAGYRFVDIHYCWKDALTDYERAVAGPAISAARPSVLLQRASNSARSAVGVR
ncbi:MAG TPA: TIGR03087 family PEP-CTERM/XrtA system glycosyltransferase [Phycisphaerae bacterium]|nr:TIGR03087 family PEP-CTERM/XrtA system glycosyltransferase [Phycisphaerae bacterium]